jgi:hypothetical protein
MSNSKLVISNQKIKLIENRNNLQIKKGKIILNEDVTDVSTEQAFSMISDTGKSLLNIGKGITKMYIAQMKMSSNFLLLPLTKNLDSVIKSYEQDINEVNKLFTDSIPSNVQKTSQLLNISNNPSSFVFTKIFDNLQKIEGVSQVINAKNVLDAAIPPPLQRIVDNFYESGKDIPGGLWNIVTKDLPGFFKVESSTYSSIDKESRELKELNDEINNLFGSRKGIKGRGISGLTIKTSDAFENYSLGIINSILTKAINPIVNDFFSNDDNCVNLFHTLLHCQANDTASNIYKDPGFDSRYGIASGFWKNNAENVPPASDYIIRKKLDVNIAGSDVYLTIKKNEAKVNGFNYDQDDCYFSLDDGTEQKTEDISFEIFF